MKNTEGKIMDINKRIQELEKELEELKANIEAGEIEAEEKVWKPEYKETYYYLDHDGKIRSSPWLNCNVDDKLLVIGNVFKSRKEAEFIVEKMKVEQELREYAEPFDPDKTQCKMIYIHGDKTIYKTSTRDVVNQGSFYFNSKETIQKAVSEIGEDRIKKYIFGVKE